MRVTDNMRLLGLVRANQITQNRLDGAARRSASGQKVTRLSDDPVAFGNVARKTSSLATLSSRTRAARDAADELLIAERALDSASNILEQASSLAVQGANETLSQTDRNALAIRAKGLFDELLAAANTKSTGGYVFSGTQTDTLPFDNAGVFVGNDGIRRVPIGEGLGPRANASGARAFTALGGRDVFTDLMSLESALSTGNLLGIRNSIGALRQGHEQIVEVQVDAGLSIERLQTAADVLEGSSVTLSTSRTRAAGADDFAGLATALVEANNAYERSLEATKRLLALPSLSG